MLGIFWKVFRRLAVTKHGQFLRSLVFLCQICCCVHYKNAALEL